MAASRVRWVTVAACGAAIAAGVSVVGPEVGLAAESTISVPIATGADDAEEGASGSVSLTGNDLELGVDGSSAQTVGMRFTGVGLPRGAVVSNAYVQLTADEVKTGSATLTITGHAADNSAAFTTATRNVSSRPRTSPSVGWVPAPWPAVGGAGVDQRTPNVATILQEIVNRPGWSAGNALSLLVTGSGVRTAEPFEGGPEPVLVVSYVTGPVANTAPVVAAGADQTITLATGALLDGTVTDDDLPQGAPVTTSWSMVSGPGSTTFTDPAAVDTTATFTDTGIYILRLTATDGTLTTTDDLTITALDTPVPTPGLSQTAFRVRSGDTEALNATAGWAAPPNSLTTVDAERRFRLRIEVEEGAGTSASRSFRLEVRRNGGGWTALPVYPTVNPGSASGTSPVELHDCTTYTDGQPTTDLLAGSARPFVAGSGEENNATDTWSAANAQGEWEWCLRIRLFSDGAAQSRQGDRFDFRMVTADGSPFPGTYVNAALQLNVPPGEVGGTYSETPGRIGPMADTNGSLYVVLEPTETDPRFMMLRSTDGGRSWSEVDGLHRPSSEDLEAVDVYQDGPTLHIAHQGHSSNHVVYHTFRTSDHPTNPDTWDVRDELVAQDTTDREQNVAIGRRTDGSVVVLYATKLGSDYRIAHRTRAPGGGWGAVGLLDTGPGEFQSVSGIMAEGDAFHLFYSSSSDGTLYHRVLGPTGALSARDVVSSALAVGERASRSPLLPPVRYGTGTAETIVVGYVRADDRIETATYLGGTDPVIQLASDVAVAEDYGTSRQPVAFLANDDTTVHLLYADAATLDIHHDRNIASSGWGTDVEVRDAVTAHFLRGSVLTHAAANGGGVVLAFLWDTGSNGYTGDTRYDEVTISNVVAAPLWHADADVDVDVDASSNTLFWKKEAIDPSRLSIVDDPAGQFGKVYRSYLTPADITSEANRAEFAQALLGDGDTKLRLANDVTPKGSTQNIWFGWRSLFGGDVVADTSHRNDGNYMQLQGDSSCGGPSIGMTIAYGRLTLRSELYLTEYQSIAWNGPPMSSLLGSWHSFVLHVHFSKDAAIGYLEVWLDGTRQIMRNGQARIYFPTVCPNDTYVYPKLGVYGMDFAIGAGPQHWFDSPRIGTSYAAAMPR